MGFWHWDTREETAFVRHVSYLTANDLPMMRLLTACLFCLLASPLAAQSTLPAPWIGDWQGDLTIYGPDGPTVQVVMQLQIRPTDSLHRYDWTIVYVSPDSSRPADRRLYELIGQRDQPGHFVMDEKNSILLDAYLFDETLSSFFRVNETMLLANYTYLGGDSLRVEMFAISTEGSRLSGEAADVEVEAYRSTTYHQALLRRQE